jgi:signal transduction histidine kinase
MRGPFRPPLFVVALALLALIGVLGTLQYRWLGRISEAERDRMRAALGSGAASFVQDFDGELTRAYLLFQTDPLGEPEDLAARFAGRYDRWHATSRFPALIKEFYAFAPGAPDARLQRFDPSTRTLSGVEWPASMADWREHLSDGTAAETSSIPGGKALVIRRMASAIWEDVPAIVVPSPVLLTKSGPRGFASALSDPSWDPRHAEAPRFSYSILVVDQEYVANEMLPALADRYLTRTNGAEFNIAVVSRGPRGRVLFHSSPDFNPAPDSGADATADLFSVRTQDFSRVAGEVHRVTAFAATLRTRTRGALKNEPFSIFVQPGAGGALPPPGTVREVTTTQLGEATRPAWQLLLKHQSGSLEDAVSDTRRRNLIVSSSILGVLGASMGLLVLSTRRAQRLATQQMEFVATVSHELRTPLAVIRSAAENLADGVVQDEGKIREYGELMRTEGRRLTEMVEQVLEFAGIEAGRAARNAGPVEVPPLVRAVLDANAEAIAACGMQVQVDMPGNLPAVLGDEPALRRLLQNLVGNAVKYGAAGRWIGIDAHARKGEVAITVADRGMGIEPSEQARIFEPFYRVPSARAAQIQGAGLGLSLVRRIAEAHGGRIAVRSSPGAGAAFTVCLPAAGERHVSRAAQDGRSADPAAAAGSPRHS